MQNYHATNFSILSYLHSKNIVHRDLQPKHIMVCQEGDEILLKLVDFENALNMISGKISHEVVGQSHYIAPEVLKRQYDYLCDVWSAGIIMCVLLTGAPPYNAKSDEDILMSIENE